MLTARQAQDLTGVAAAELLLLALTQQIPSYRDPYSRLIMFDSSTLQDWSVTHGTNLRSIPPTR